MMSSRTRQEDKKKQSWHKDSASSWWILVLLQGCVFKCAILKVVARDFPDAVLPHRYDQSVMRFRLKCGVPGHERSNSKSKARSVPMGVLFEDWACRQARRLALL
mmetsp:Transcript_16733/g.34515  ORF Transcript_16733/g.34515 Transcript_16733/m.34515 type:complete len:105 (-) Transcript_16733:128-442(-)